MFAYHETRPSAALSPYVKCFWTLRAESETPRPERIIPDGSFELVFHLGDPFPGQPQAMFVGEIRRPVTIQPSPRAHVFGVRFRVGGAAVFFKPSAHALRDAMFPLAEVVNAEPLFEAADRIAFMESFFARRFHEPKGNSLARGAAALIRHRSGRLRIREVASKLGATERTLERAFESSIGMSAKTYSRLTRFHAMLRGDDNSYFDDSHRLRDFHEFAGATPTELERERNAMNEAFVGNVQD